MTAVLDAPETATQLIPIPVGVNLLPAEIIDARRGRRMRTYVAGGLIVVVGVLVAAYVLALGTVSGAQSALARTEAQTADLTRQQNSFGSLVQARSGAAAIETTLAGLTKSDVDWSATLGAIESAAPRGLTFISIAGTVSAAGSTGPATAALVPGAVGTLTVTGTAPDKATLAAYVDALGQVRGVSSPLPTSTAITTNSTSTAVTFTISAALTKDAFSSRYATAKGAK